jgi:hypothetical protein
MPPESGARALCRTRDLVNGRGWLRGLRLIALTLTAVAIFHTVEYTETVYRIANEAQRVEAPARSIAEAIAAGVAWTVYAVIVSARRRQALRESTTR